MPEEIINHGVLVGESPLGTDYHADVNSPLGFEPRRPSGDWTPDLPTEEWQKDPTKPGTDKMNCVTQSYHNCIETIMIADRREGRMSDFHWDWLKANGYIDKNGKPNFNDRISAILNETTHDGNWLYKVAEKAREYGLFPETVLPSDESLSWDEYYRKELVTPDILKIGLEFKKYFLTNYEWVNVLKLSEHIMHTPLQIVKPGHAIEEITKPDPLKYFDTYKPFIKSLNASNVISAMKHLVTYKETDMTIKNYKILILSKNADGSERKDYGVLTRTPNTDIITKAEDEAEWRSYSKSDSYGAHTMNSDGSTDWSVDITIDLR